jgi:hypothetical protein
MMFMKTLRTAELITNRLRPATTAKALRQKRRAFLRLLRAHQTVENKKLQRQKTIPKAVGWFKGLFSDAI